MAGSNFKPNLVAALQKSGLGQISSKNAHFIEMFKKELFTPEMEYRQTIFEPLDGNLVGVVTQFIKGALATGQSSPLPRFCWAAALAQTEINPQELFCGINHGGVGECIRVESWWTRNENEQGLGSYNLKIFHKQAAIMNPTEKDAFCFSEKSHAQGVLIQIRMICDPSGQNFKPVILVCIQNEGNCGVSEFSHLVQGIVPINKFTSLEPTLDELYYHLFENHHVGLADLLVPDEVLEKIYPLKFEMSSICLIRYEHLDKAKISEAFMRSGSSRLFLKHLLNKEILLACNKDICLWEYPSVIPFPFVDKTAVSRKNFIPEVLLCKFIQEFIQIGDMVIIGAKMGKKILPKDVVNELIKEKIEFESLFNDCALNVIEKLAPETKISDATPDCIRFEKELKQETVRRFGLERKIQQMSKALAISAERETEITRKLKNYEDILDCIQRAIGAGKNVIKENLAKRVSEFAGARVQAILRADECQKREIILQDRILQLETELSEMIDGKTKKSESIGTQIFDSINVVRNSNIVNKIESEKLGDVNNPENIAGELIRYALGLSEPIENYIKRYDKWVRTLGFEELIVETARIPELAYRNLLLENLNDEFENESLGFQIEADEQRQRAGKLQRQLDRILSDEARIEDTSIPFDLIDGLICEKWGIYGGYVRLLQFRYQDRVIFLKEAMTSADDCIFSREQKAKKLLLDLVTRYYDALITGEGNQAGLKIFGPHNFAQKESVTLSSDGIKARIRYHEGEKINIESHLKLTFGQDRSSNNVFRVYFDWDGKRRKIIVGHIGKHLPL